MPDKPDNCPPSKTSLARHASLAIHDYDRDLAPSMVAATRAVGPRAPEPGCLYRQSRQAYPLPSTEADPQGRATRSESHVTPHNAQVPFPATKSREPDPAPRHARLIEAYDCAVYPENPTAGSTGETARQKQPPSRSLVQRQPVKHPRPQTPSSGSPRARKPSRHPRPSLATQNHRAARPPISNSSHPARDWAPGRQPDAPSYTIRKENLAPDA